MNDKQTTRRRFIVAALTFSAVAINLPGISWLKSSAAWAQSDDDSASPAMVRLARMLFPHAGMPDSTYREIMGTVLAALAANPDSAGLVGAAEQALDARRDKPWVELDEADQAAAVAEIQGEAFFAAILGTVRGVFYTHPLVWAHIGYPGSSKEYGGYRNRGFDDIDWLPGDA
ncbi:MAG: hypothetical protein ACO22K_09590 [Woeseiaceae bacterium]|jgi:hypothetical protein